MSLRTAGTIRWVGTADRIDACICFTGQLLSSVLPLKIYLDVITAPKSGSPVSTPVCVFMQHVVRLMTRVWWRLLNESLFTLRCQCTQLPRYQSGPIFILPTLSYQLNKDAVKQWCDRANETEGKSPTLEKNASLKFASVLGAACSHRTGFHTSETRTWGLSRTAFNMIMLFAAYRCYDTLYIISDWPPKVDEKDEGLWWR